MANKRINWADATAVISKSNMDNELRQEAISLLDAGRADEIEMTYCAANYHNGEPLYYNIRFHIPRLTNTETGVE